MPSLILVHTSGKNRFFAFICLMKKYFVLCALVMAVAIIGCKNNDKASGVAGKWKVTDANIEMKDFPQEMMGEVKKAVLTTIYNFNADSTLVIESSGRTMEPGKWKFNAEKNIISLDSDGDGTPENDLQIVSQEGSKMVVKNDKGEDGKIELTLEKVVEEKE